MPIKRLNTYAWPRFRPYAMRTKRALPWVERTHSRRPEREPWSANPVDRVVQFYLVGKSPMFSS